MTDPEHGPSVLWLTPDKPENISVGRAQIRDNLEDAGMDVTIRGSTRSTILESLRDGGRFDVVVGTTRLGAFAGALVSIVHGIPLVVDHIDPIRQFRETNGRWQGAAVERLENVVFRLADRVLYVYPEERSRVERYTSAPTKTNLGVNVDKFTDPADEALDAAREKLGEIDDHVVIYVGGLEPIYSISTLIDATDRLDGWTLLVIGAGSLEDEVRDAARNRDDIVYPGTVPHDDVPGYLACAEVGVSLVDDPHTLKVLEYGLAGLPIVQLDGLARERYDGMVEFCNEDPADVARAIVDAKQRGPSEELAEYAAGFDWEAVSEDYREVIAAAVRHQ